jgi:F-type H+-transporting ATPase subunit a
MADSSEIIRHAQDSDHFLLPLGIEIHIPQPFAALGFHITKFMVLELVAVVLMFAVFIPLGRRIATGKPLRGRFWNFMEVMLIFIRDEVARPSIGKHDADRFLPFLWQVFFFILFMNLLGLIPSAGSPTSALAVTAALAVVAYVTMLGAGIAKFGPLGYWVGQIPHMDVPWVLAIFLKPMIFIIEVGGMAIKHSILAVRLFANMFGGHLVLAVIIGFVAETARSWIWYGVMPASVLGATALGFLELMVAFLQAYVFTFLAALFIGMSVHQH